MNLQVTAFDMPRPPTSAHDMQSPTGATPPPESLIPVRRAFARLYGRCPLIPLTSGILLGQTALYGWCASDFVVVGLVLVGFLLIAGGAVRGKRTSRVRADFLAGALLGVCAAWVAQPTILSAPRVDQVPSSERWVTLLVSAGPVRPAPGLVRFDARVIAEHSRTQGDERLPSARGERWECRAIDLPWRQIAGLRAGDVIMVRAAVTAPEVTGGLFSYSAQLSRRGIVRRCRIKVATRIHPQHAGPLESLRDKLRDSVRQQLGNNERSGLVLSLVIGERHALSTHTEQAFKRTGLSHVLVLSGYQVALFFGVVWWLTKQGFAFAAKIIGALRLPISDSLRVVRAGTTLPSLLALGLTALALLVIGFEPSSTRAMIALAVVVLARLEERHTSMGNMLVLALLILSLIAPGSALEPSTQLTFAALAGIFVAHHLRVPGEGVLRTYARTSFWVTLFPLLVGALWFDMLPLAGVICNPLLAPLVALWGTLGGACAMVALLSGLDSSGFAIGVIADGLVLMRELIVVVASGLPRWAYQPGPSLTVVLLLAGILITLRGLTQLVRRGLQHWNLRVLTPLRGVTPTD